MTHTVTRKKHNREMSKERGPVWMNCTALDDALAQAEEFVARDEGGLVLVVSAVSIVSLALLVYGEHLVRPLSAIVAAAAGSVLVYTFSNVLFGWDCLTRLIASALTGLVLALLALCLFKSGLVLVGAAGFGTVAHFAYEALPLDDGDAFQPMGRSGYYYLTMAVATSVGSIVACVQKKHLMRLSSSLVAGGGLAVAVHLVTQRAEVAIPSVLFFVIVLGSGLVGVSIQRALSARRKRRRRAPPASMVVRP